MNQLLEIEEIRECHDLIKFLIMPDLRSTVVAKNLNNVQNKIYGIKAVENKYEVQI